MMKFRTKLGLVLAAAAALSLAVSAPAEARRGGSFGSRGMRTYSSPSYSGGYVAPVQRSMTPNTGSPYAQPGYAPSPYGSSYGAPYRQPYRPGFGSGLAAGLLTGGLIGGMMGHGWGGGWGGGYGGYGGYGAGAGLLGLLFQLAIIGGIIWFVLRLFRRRRQGYEPGYEPPFEYGAPPTAVPSGGFGLAGPGQQGGGPWGGPWGSGPGAGGLQIPITSGDRSDFARLLNEVQGAYAREDFAALRERCTPEIVSFLSEELSQNAVQGRRNEVSNLNLQQLDVTEAWREADADYATAALRYESIDVMRDRQSGAVVQGDPSRPTATTELWTFVRRAGGPWKLSAIQET